MRSSLVNNFIQCAASSFMSPFIICAFSVRLLLPQPSPINTQSSQAHSLSCQDTLCFMHPRMEGGSPSVYFFTMSAPQAAHATSTCPLMLLDQEQVVNIVQFEGFSTAGCTLCFAKQKDCVSKCP